MAIKNLKDLYLDQLRDLYSACKQSLPIVTEMGRAAKSSELSEALISGNQGISEGMDILTSLCNEHGIDPTGEHCKGMEGLVTEARKHALETEFADEDAQDAAIITQYQRMAHYAIAGYGCVRTFANRLGLDGDAARLQECLDNTWEGDRHMTKIAEGGVNKAAAT
ncbi:ferritin-like domain-containing protein [Paracoccus aerodenitrificans]|uniref:ferritin-like domain-containing protein n=1 Tax=Paracoccus aerodenitrificans TaxID=3017781 RepID=UPI0022F0B106|nr:ferritin-like domain-containing protein [Paracoccus aerodenitrificans]WBU63134.1 ferritin-like domain-containing protein [Paracoccus aerodenitrificans]